MSDSKKWAEATPDQILADLREIADKLSGIYASAQERADARVGMPWPITWQTYDRITEWHLREDRAARRRRRMARKLRRGWA